MKTNRLSVLLSLGGTLLLTVVPARAHCDTLNGPVVLAAREALQQGQVTPVLKWVKGDAEPEIRAAFDRTLQVRRLSPEAAELTDAYFFETLVRVHRQGEGAPYSGLKPASAADPAIEAADRALATGQVDSLVADLAARLGAKLRAQFAELKEREANQDHNVDAGRAYVAAYVTFIHLFGRLAAEADRADDDHAAHAH